MKKLIALMGVALLIGSNAIYAQYLDWNTVTNSGDIKEALYGATSVYDDLWSVNTCPAASSMNVVEVNPGTAFQDLGNLQTGNTIYVLKEGIHTITSTKYIMTGCVAIVGENDNAKIYAKKKFPFLPDPWKLTSTIEVRGPINNVILNGLYLEGEFDGTANHAYNTYGININTTNGSVNDNSFNGNTITHHEYAVHIFGQSATNNADNNIFTNNTFIENTYGVSIVEPTGVTGTTNGTTLSGNEFIDNGTAVTDSGSTTTVDNNLFSGNTTVGETGTNATGTNFPVTGLVEGDQCTNFGGCECTAGSGSSIADGDYCSDGSMTNITTEGGSTTCSDPDGCTCFGAGSYPFNNTFSCTDGNTTTLSNGQQCTDPDGCTCDGSALAFGAYCRIITTSGWGGGGGSSPTADYCPNWDFTSSYYDGSCGVPDTNGELSLGGVVDDDTYVSYSIVEKSALLAGEYEALVAQGETSLRHGEFFRILQKYVELKDITNTQLKVIVGVLIDVFTDMSEATLAKYGFDKTIFLQELARLIG